MISADRKSMPGIQIPKLGILPEIEEFKLDNNITLFQIGMGLEDLLRLDFIFDAGQVFENKPLQASTTNMMLLEGSKARSAEEINRLLDFYGTFPNLITEKDSAGFSIIFMNRHLDRITDLCREILFEPVFPKKEFRILINNRLQQYLVNREKIQTIAREMFFESIYGADHPYGRQILREDFKNITTDKLEHFHRRFYNPGNMVIIASGKLHDSFPEIMNRSFGALDPELAYQQQGIRPVIRAQDPQKISVRKDGAVQSAIRIGKATINKTHTDYPGLKVVNMVLGGYFGSRLMKNIREDKGYSYGIHSAVASLRDSGFISISTEVGSNYTQYTLQEIYKEIRALQNEPVGAEELDVVRGYMMGELIRLFDGPCASADTFRSVWEFGLGIDYFRKFERRIKTITPDEIIHLARTYYNIAELNEIITGPG